MSGTDLTQLLRSEFTFAIRERPVPAEDRPVWRVPFVLLLVDSCRGKRATPQQLHVLSWAIRSTGSREEFAALFVENESIDRAVVRFEPALDRGISIAAGYGFLRFAKGTWELTPLGKELLQQIRDADTLFDTQTKLNSLDAAVTQAKVKRMVQRGAANK